MMQLQNFVVSGILFLGVCNSVVSKPSSLNDSEEMQADEYDYYSDDQNGSNQQIKPVPVHSNVPQIFFSKSNITVNGILGKDITLQCDAKNLKDEVVLWYKDQNVISTGKNLVSPYYSLDSTTYALTVVNATKDSQGDYFCELFPQKIRMHTTVNVAEYSTEISKSKSSQKSISFLMVTVSGTLLMLSKFLG